MIVRIHGHCPRCGRADLIAVPLADHSDAKVNVRCNSGICEDSFAASKVLADPEIHHIVRFDNGFDNASGTFNVQHPLRERIDGMLLDCSIHAVINDDVIEGVVEPEGAWRLIGIPAIPSLNGGYHPQEAQWVWEEL